MLKRIIIVYGLFLVLIVIMADSGAASGLFSILAQVPLGDKLGHFLLMGMMSFLLTLVTETRVVALGGISFWKGPFWLAIIVTLEEFSQVWLDHRGFSLLDLAFDYLGILVFARVASWLRSRANISDKRLRL